MFKLQRLEITGFKSFADYTEIIFTGNGITAVVGPNGCGKSNVSDAISWVLGEQRPTSLRGQEMKDVVFQGTSKRNPSGLAEVVLHLVRDEVEYISDETELEDIDETLGEIDENSVDIADIEGGELIDGDDVILLEAEIVGDEVIEEKVRAAQVGSIQTVERKIRSKRRWRPRNFALEFAPGEAVTVTRRLYLSGESEYLLNNKTCRLRDIQDLFAGTGLSGAHYAIIEQGRIGQILSAKPSNRRSLIEEAAGISKFRIRQRAAESRLASAKLNLGRISDIVSEIEKQTRSLRRQASKTRRYKILREELRALLKQTYAAEGAFLLKSVADLDKQLETAVRTERESFESVSKKDEEFRAATNEARQAEEKVSAVRAAHAENALNRDRTVREHEFQVQRIEELRNRAVSLRAEYKVTGERILDLDKELKRLRKEEERERLDAEKERSRLEEAQAVYAEKLELLNEREAVLETERVEHLQHNSAVERLSEISRQFENNLEKLRERTEGLEREHERAEETHTDRKQEASSLADELKNGKGKLSELEEERRGILAKTEKHKGELEEKLESLSVFTNEYSRVKHRLETLEELEAKREIYAPSVQRVFSEQKKIGARFLGTLADELNVEKRAELAVENLFGNHLQIILVSSVADARKTVEYLNRNDLGRIGILVVDEKAGGAADSASNGVGSLASVLGVRPAVAAALKSVFPREMSAILVEDLVEAEKTAGSLAVSFKGDIVAGGRLFVAGRGISKEKNVSILGFKRELGDLKKKSRALTDRIGQAELIVAQVRQKLAGHEDKLVDLQSFIVKVERELLSKEIHSKSLGQEIERAERHKRVVADEISQNVSEIKQLTERKKEAAEGAELAGKAMALSSEKLKRIVDEINAARKVVEDENAVLNRKRTKAEVAAERQRSAKAALERVELEKSELESRLERQRNEIEEIEKRSGELESSSALLKEKIEAAVSEIEREEVELKESIAHLSSARQNSDAMSAELTELNKLSARARDERAGLEIRRTESVSGLKNLNEKCSEDLNAALQELVEITEIDEDFELESSKTKVRGLRHRLDNFGAINMLALEELSETEERLDFLTSQRQDITDSISAAEEALREIKRRSRQKFRDAFDAINVNFAEYFRELFGGGNGEMVLMESDDVLEAGVEIIAQPPGKRLQNMLLLSGGEKAMTAIALVLAIFKYRPSPFCLLDEVDAPLDDANVSRFVGRIEEMSENTQFIVITHNKRTMEAARALYGVTMQEPGISKIVSVRFE